MIAVLTGDIVFSSSSASPQSWLGQLKEIFKDIEQAYEVIGTGAEMHRGDGFQLGLAKPYQSLEAALLIRAGLIKSSLTNKKLDTRIAIGIGEYTYLGKSVNESGGDVFERSGHALDALKDETVRIALSSLNDDFNDEMKTSLMLADVLIRSWSKADAEIAWYSWIKDMNQAEIADKLGISQPAVSKRKARAHLTELEALIERFSKKTKQMTYE